MEVGVWAALSLGLLTGFRHAFEPDHVVAVSTLLHEEPRLRSALKTGMAWGAGHTLILMLGVVAVTTFRLEIAPEQLALLELPVAAMLVGLGAWAIGSSARRLTALRRHTHDGIPHYHVGDTPHPHRFSTSWRGFSVGLVHGLAGSGALLLLVAATVPSALLAVTYALAFGGGSLVGMGLATTALAVPLTASRSRPLLFHGLTALCGVASIALGVFLTWDVLA